MEVPGNSEIICKICHCGDSPSDPFMTPCQCTGSMRYIHTSCLLECVRSSSQCGICCYKFKFRKVFKENTPSRIPLSCLAGTLLRNAGRVLTRLLCLVYVGLRILFITSLNSVVMRGCVYDAAPHGLFPVLLLGLLLTAVNFFHNYAFGVIYNTMNSSSRMRMNTRRALSSVVGDLASRAGGRHDTEDLSASGMEDLHVEENSSTTSLIGEYDVGAMLSESIFRVPTFQKLWSDFIQAHSLVWFSVLMYALDGLFGAARRSMPFGTGCFPGRLAGMSSFIDSTGLQRPFFILHSYILFILCLSYVLYVLKVSTKGCLFNYVYNCSKFYFSVITGILYGFFVLGTATHAAAALLINGGTPVVTMSAPLASFVVHVSVGFSISRFLRCVKEKILGSFRPGLYFNPYRTEQTGQIIEYVLCSSWASLIYVSVLNILLSAAVAVCAVSAASCFCPPLHIPDDRTTYLSIKLFFMALAASLEFGSVLHAFYARIIVALVSLFRMQNFVYNRPIAIPDRRRLEWDLNVNSNSKSLVQEVCHINRLIRAEDGRNGDPAENKGRAASSGVAEADRKIIQKYKITDRKIEKYFGRSHHGRFSIFYRPRFYTLYKTAIFLACVLFTLGLMVSILGTASLVARALKLEGGISFLFVCLCISRAVACAGKVAVLGMKGFSKLILLHVYTNLVWPVAASVVYFFIFYASDDVVCVSHLFLLFSAFSGAMQFFFTQFVFALPVHEYSFQFLLQKLASVAVTKSALVLLYAIYTRMLGLRIMLCLLTGLVATSWITRFATTLVSGQWLEEVKDHYFLKTISVVNYTPEDPKAKK